jgi:hypothetical protein
MVFRPPAPQERSEYNNWNVRPLWASRSSEKVKPKKGFDGAGKKSTNANIALMKRSYVGSKGVTEFIAAKRCRF